MEYQHNHNQTSITGWLSKFAKAPHRGRKNVGIPGLQTQPIAARFCPHLQRRADGPWPGPSTFSVRASHQKCGRKLAEDVAGGISRLCFLRDRSHAMHASRARSRFSRSSNQTEREAPKRGGCLKALRSKPLAEAGGGCGLHPRSFRQLALPSLLSADATAPCGPRDGAGSNTGSSCARTVRLGAACISVDFKASQPPDIARRS